jgi:hypothetical protein
MQDAAATEARQRDRRRSCGCYATRFAVMQLATCQTVAAAHTGEHVRMYMNCLFDALNPNSHRCLLGDVLAQRLVQRVTGLVDRLGRLNGCVAVTCSTSTPISDGPQPPLTPDWQQVHGGTPGEMISWLCWSRLHMAKPFCIACESAQASCTSR